MASKDRKINFKVSDKMMSDFDRVLSQNEETKSEVLRACIREYIKKNKG
jgi:metal-responsive CopG/Arc/MetJ family transcriptional regulator